MNNIRLSICIPTYNRCDSLRELLDCIMKQYCDDIEIVVSDNGSDLTAEMIKKYPVKYNNNGDNIGFDRNLLCALNMAQGQYCWTLNDTVLIKDNAIKYLLNILSSDCGVYIIDPKENFRETIYDNGSEALKYYGTFGGKLSRVILKKNKIINGYEYVLPTCGWLHLSLALCIASKEKICFIPEILVYGIALSNWAKKDGQVFIAYLNHKAIIANCVNFGYDSKVISEVEKRLL